MKKRILSLALTLCMLISLMPGLTLTAKAADGTVYPYYVITMGADATEAAAGNYYIYKKANGTGSFAAFTTSSADVGTAYSTIGNAITAVTTDVTSGSSATIQFGLTGTTDESATGTLDIGSEIVVLGASGAYTIKGDLTGSSYHVIELSGASVEVEVSGGTVSASDGMAIYSDHGSGDIIVSGGMVSASDGSAIYSDYGSGDIIVSGGTVSASDNDAIRSYGSGNIIVSGGTVTCSAEESGYAISNFSTGSVTVSSGRVESTNNAIYNEGGDITVSGGTVESTHDDAICNEGSGNITVSGDGLVTSGDEGDAINIGFESSGNITISGGTLTSSNEHTIYNSGSGNITISDGTLQNTGSDYSVIYCEDDSSGSITISGGTLINSGSDDSGNVIFIKDGSDVSLTITGGTLENTGEGIGVDSYNSQDITVSGGKVYSAQSYAIYSDTADLYISGNEWDEDAKTGTLIKSEATDTLTLSVSCSDALYMTGGTIIGGASSGGGAHISGGRIETANRVALFLSGSTSYISGDVIITSANTTEPSADAFVESHQFAGTVLISDMDNGDAKLYISGGTITNTAEGCPAIFNIGIRDLDPEYSDYTSEIFLSGTLSGAPSISGDADIWTNTAIHAGYTIDTSSYAYSGNALDIEYGGSITAGTTVAVDSVTADNDDLFSITNSNYYLTLDEDNGELIINAISGSWLDEGNYSTAWYDANPSTKSFTVSTAADLAGLAHLVNNGDDSFSGDTVTLANSINIGAHEWVPIGSESHPFSGVFDGNNKTISGLFIDDSSTDNQGLFGYISSGAVNTLTVSGFVTGQNQVGGIAGYAQAGVIENCVSSCTVHSSGSYVGGIAGMSYFATINGCANTGTVSAAVGYAGGIVGNSLVTDVINCSNSGAVSTEGSYAGGIAGQNASNVINCYNRGAVTGTLSGGLAGNNQGSLKNCYNTGTVTGTNSGGVIGVNDYYGLGTVTACYGLSGSASSCAGTFNYGGSLSGCGTFDSGGAITAGTAGNCGTSQTLSYGSSLLTALNKWVTLTNSAVYLDWTDDSGNTNGGYPVFGTIHAQRILTGQPGTNNAYTVTATQVTGVQAACQWYKFNGAGGGENMDVVYNVYPPILTTGRPNGFAISDTDPDHSFSGGHYTWTEQNGTYTSGSAGCNSSFSAMSIPITVAQNGGCISFERKVSSEENKDYFSYGLITGSGALYALASGTYVTTVSGDQGWTEATYSNLDAGDYYLVLVYTKNYADADGDDCASVRSVGVYEPLAGNTAARLDTTPTGLTVGDILRCTVTYDDGVVLASNPVTYVLIAAVTHNLTAVTTSNNTTSATMGGTYSATLMPTNSGYSMSVTVTMGGTDITSSAYNSSTKTVSIADVTGNIVITATASAPSNVSVGSSTPSRTITVSETSSSLFSGSAGQIKAEANMTNAFSNSVEVKVTDTEQDASGFGLRAGNEVYPFDISLYIRGTNTKTEPKDGYAVTISLPVPDKLLDVKEQLSIMHKSGDGTVTRLKSQLKQINGTWYLVFEATEFSPYALVVQNTASYDESAGLPYYVNSDGKPVFIGFAANGKYIAPSGVMVLFKKNTKAFTDTGSHWAKDYIEFVAERELFNGTGDNKFSPDTGMTRGMFAAVIGRLYERSYGEIQALSDHAFTDCDYDDYYGKYVDWAAEESIIGGYGNGKFGPDDQVTREQMAAILYRFADFLGVLPGNMDTALTYPDARSISSWAKSAALYCQTTGIITGRDGGSFVPQGTATRAEVAAIIQRFIKTIFD